MDHLHHHVTTATTNEAIPSTRAAIRAQIARQRRDSERNMQRLRENSARRAAMDAQ